MDQWSLAGADALRWIEEIDAEVGRIDVTPEQVETRKTREAKMAARRSGRRIGGKS